MDAVFLVEANAREPFEGRLAKAAVAGDAMRFFGRLAVFETDGRIDRNDL